ncbi:uncharacterized protein LOC141719343 [Apium graveolens]|uniref:uncharacterized protein LOC141719343 n=1 Tax=Apium graveolens TaxID=4045 RepID=UPI003D7AD1B9
MWGIDLIRDLPKTRGGVKYTVVAVDYFTKWAEAEPLSTITTKTTTRETPLSLVYDREAMVLVKVEARSFRRDNYESEANEINHRLYLNMIEETREDAQIRITAYQQRTARYYNSKVRAQTFKAGDWVLRRVMPNTKVVSLGVFGTNWEGPYKIKSVL